MSITHKAIRSSGWKTDFLIGFPDGLLLLFFATQVIQLWPLDVQTFYNIHLGIWLAGALLVLYSAYQANKGDAQHDSALLSDDERKKLQHLEINQQTISHIESEMKKDAASWEQILQQENVQESFFSKGRAISSAIFTSLFFILGGALSFAPYLANENFNAASQTSTLLVFLGLTVFSFMKARITAQRVLPIILRNFAIGAGIVVCVWLLHKILA